MVPDAGDGGALIDAPTDTALGDAPLDAPRLPESCEPGPEGAVDEDGNGLIDEGCPYRVTSVHALTEPLVDNSAIFGAELTDEGRRMWFVAGGQVYSSTRATTADRFTRAVRVSIGGLPGTTSLDAATITADGQTLFAQATTAVGNEVVEFTVEDGPSLVYVGPVSFGGRPLFAAYGQVIQPAVSRDGLALAFVTRMDGMLYVVRRTSRSTDFDTVQDLMRMASYPSFTPDGSGLYYTASSTGYVVDLSRPELRDPTGFDRRPFYYPPSREVFMIGTGETSGNAFEGIARGQVCRGVRCVNFTACPEMTIGSLDATHCFYRGDVSMSGGTCAAVGGATPTDRTQTATLHTPSEFTVAQMLVPATGAWIGLVPGGFEWRSGEVVTTSRFTIRPSDSECGAITTSGTWIALPCTTTLPLLCELDRWPTWSPDGT